MKPLVMVGGGPGQLPRNVIEAVEAQGRALAGYLSVGAAEPLMHARPCLGDERLLDDSSFLTAHDLVIAVEGAQRRATCERLSGPGWPAPSVRSLPTSRPAYSKAAPIRAGRPMRSACKNELV